MQMKKHPKEEAGTILIAFALFLFILLGFCALGMEAGRWYMVRAELSKSVDAGALVAAKNIANPFVAPRALAEEFAMANFPAGYLGTPGSGTGRVSFRATVSNNDSVGVEGDVSATPILAKLFGVNLVPTHSEGGAQKKEVEIMLALDRSASMSGRPMTDLKAAARGFVDLFAGTQDKDKMGLISFSTAATFNQSMGQMFVDNIKTAISTMSANGYTNAEDAIDKADSPDPGWVAFTDQTGITGARRVQQFLIFFSDGQPTAFRGRFKYRGADYDAVTIGSPSGTLGCDPTNFPDPGNLYDRLTGATLTPTVRPTGDGVASIRCQGSNQTRYTTRWYIFDTMPVPGYTATATCIPTRNLAAQFCYIANQLAINHAADLKAKNIVIYTIGLGDVDETFMRAIANPNLYYHAPTSADLQAIFRQVARDITLRLVQ
jgi:Flp pilus assembly protein TadG